MLLDLQKLQNKSVALQGLGALEYLLYGTGGDKIGKQAQQMRTNFAVLTRLLIAKNLVAISKAGGSQEWRDGEKFVETLPSPR